MSGSDVTTGQDEANLRRIRDAFAHYLQPAHKDEYLIIETEPDGKFVQFTGTTDGALLLDLPLISLDESECSRAKDFFQHRFQLPPPAEGEGYAAYQMPLDRDADALAALTARIFVEVFGFPAPPPTKFTIDG